jgi:hypothetical protein
MMETSPQYQLWQQWCEEKIPCEIRYLNNQCTLKVTVSPILSVDKEKQALEIAGKVIPFRNVVSVRLLKN